MLSTLSLLRLLSAIAVVESNTNDHAIGAAGERGRYQISSSAVIDVNRLYGMHWDWWSDSMEPRKAERIALLYLWYYAHESELGRIPTLEDAARIWNGGPDGWKQPATKAYWKRVEHEMHRQFWGTLGDRIPLFQDFRDWCGLDSHDTMGAWQLPPSKKSPGVPSLFIPGTTGASSSPSAPATSSSSASSGSAATGIPSISFRSTTKRRSAKRAPQRASRSRTSRPAKTPARAT